MEHLIKYSYPIQFYDSSSIFDIAKTWNWSKEMFLYANEKQ